MMNLREYKLLELSNLKGRIFKYLLVILLIGCNFIDAKATNVDSLLTLISSSTSGVERIELMQKLSSALKDIDLEQSLVYAQKALELASQIDDKEKKVEALLNVGNLLYETSDRDSALAYFEKGESLAEQSGLKKLQVDNLIKIGKWYRYYRIDSTKAVNCFLKSMEVSKSANYHEGTGRSYAKLASFYTKYKHIELCEKYLDLSAKYYIQIENGSEEIAHYCNEVGDKVWDYNPKAAMDFYLKGMEYFDTYPNLKVNLARVHSLIGEPEIALQYLKGAFPYIDTVEQKRMLGIAFAQLAEVYIQLNDFESAEKVCDKGIALLTPLGRGSKRALPTLYRSKGMIAEHAGDDEAALAFYTKSMEVAIKIRFGFDRLKSQLAIGFFYLNKDLKKSKLFCRRSLETAQKNKHTSIEVEACDCLYNVYKKENASAEALKYYEQKTELSDSLNILSVKHTLEINSKISKKDKQLAEQAYQKEIRDSQLESQYTLNKILLLSSLVALSLIVFLMLSIRKVRKQNIEITEKRNELNSVNLNLARSNDELERFAYVASHDLKSPLRNIISFTTLLRRTLKRENGLSPSVEEFLGFIEVNGKRMNRLIKEILDYSKLSNQDINKEEDIELNGLVSEISQIILNNSDNTSINIEASTLPNLKWNYSKIYLLFKNLIENGLKYNESELPTIKIYSTNDAGNHKIHIEDNGIGIKKEYFDKIFVMFQRLHTQSEYEGTGLGLATCKKIVEEFEGNIAISSELGKGTAFVITLPDHLIV